MSGHIMLTLAKSAKDKRANESDTWPEKMEKYIPNQISLNFMKNKGW